MRKPDNLILVIFGASGDLTRRKLIPAIYELKKQKILCDRFAILGVGRTTYSDVAFRDKMLTALNDFVPDKTEQNGKAFEEFSRHMYYLSIDTTSKEGYQKLRTQLNELDKKHQTKGNYIYYLATPPSLYAPIAELLASQQLNIQENGNGWKRLIVEKPFGYDLNSARNLNQQLKKYFKEDQIFRIDHYLGKETVQNILVTRFSNSIFEPLWNRNYIHHVEITSAEDIGVEGRGGYYDNAGVLRDMVQNHLLQLVALVAMEPPIVAESNAIRNEMLKVFQSLRPLSPEDVKKNVIRGQYTASTLKGKPVSGYRDEKGVAPDSKTETYVAMKFFIDNWRWSGVPFFIRSGKRLPTKVTEIVIHFMTTHHHIFSDIKPSIQDSNQLIIRIQPDEGLLMKYGMKVPGAGYRMQNINMDFHYSDLAETQLPDAYERLLHDCMLGDSTLYSRGDAVETTWKFIDPILKVWDNNSDIKIYGYPAGWWGPKESDDLFNEKELTWRYPCKNLASDGRYCEL